MSERIELSFGRETWALTVRPEQVVRLSYPDSSPPAAGTPRELVAESLMSPFGFDAPVYRALTPDDRVAIVLDEALPHIPELLSGVLEHLARGGIGPEAVAVVLPPGGTGNDWLDELPDEFGDLRLEVHDPEDPKKLAYLATTKAGSRVYLNRTVVEAEFVLTLSGRRYDPTFGRGGAETAVYPTLADGDALAAVVGKFLTRPPSEKTIPVVRHASEICWLFGSPIFVQVIEGPGETIHHVLAGLPDSTEEGARRQDARWRGSVPHQPDLVVAAVSGPRASFLDLAKALASAARVVRSGGRVVLLTDVAPPLLEGAEILRTSDEPDLVEKRLIKRKPDDWPAAALWTKAARSANLFVHAGWPDETVEELFATPVATAAEVQRLIDSAERVLILPDAQKSIVDLA